MKSFRTSILTALILLAGSNFSIASENPIENTRIETINEHAFFILRINKEKVELSYGDKVELIFGHISKVTVYNISGQDIEAFTNPDELVVLISSEDLRCFKNKKLRKVKIYTNTKPVVIKINIGANHLKIK